jgi:hypothetical protein
VQPSESTATVSVPIPPEIGREAVQVAAISFLALFGVVGLALWGFPFDYDFMVRQFGWSRAEVSATRLGYSIFSPFCLAWDRAATV